MMMAWMEVRFKESHRFYDQGHASGIGSDTGMVKARIEVEMTKTMSHAKSIVDLAQSRQLTQSHLVFSMSGGNMVDSVGEPLEGRWKFLPAPSRKQLRARRRRAHLRC